MASSFTKSYATDFNSSLSEDILQIELNNNTNITPVCVSVGRNGDSVVITYDSDLSAAEETEQDDVVIPSHAEVDFEANYLETKYAANGDKLSETWYAKKVGAGSYAYKVKETLYTVVNNKLTTEVEKHFTPDGTEITTMRKSWNYLTEIVNGETFVRKEDT